MDTPPGAATSAMSATPASVLPTAAVTTTVTPAVLVSPTTSVTTTGAASPTISISATPVTTTATVTATIPVTASLTGTGTPSSTTVQATSGAAVSATASPTAPVSGTATVTATGPLSDPAALYAHLPLSFERNVGQTDGSVAYVAHGAGGTVFLTSTEAVLALAAPATDTVGLTATVPMGGRVPEHPGPPARMSVIRLSFPSAAAAPRIEGQDPLTGTANYFVGSDPTQWHTGIPTFAHVTYHDVYPGISLMYHGDHNALEYDWQVAPGADPRPIRLSVSGARGLSLDAQGDLVLRTDTGTLVQHIPHAYQKDGRGRHDVGARYTLAGPGQVGLALDAYDGSQPLVIDPVLNYSTYLGGSGDDQGNGITVDGAGSAYVTGRTSSPNFPTSTGFGPAGSNDLALVSKFSADGQSLVYSAYLGGTFGSEGAAVAVDVSGNAFVAGQTGATDFPTTPGANQTTSGGNGDVFVAKVNPTGTALLYSTYIGGPGGEGANAIAVDSFGDAYIAGRSASGAGYPTTANAVQATSSLCCGLSSAIVSELSPDGATLLYSTYLGGSGDTYANGIALDGQGNAYVTGYTASSTFPTTSGAYQTSYSGGACASLPCYDGFVTELDTTNGGLVYSTYLGPSGTTYAYGIALDGRGNIYVSGVTTSTRFPTTPGAYQTQNHGGYDAFVVEFDGGSDTLLYGTYLGGSGVDWAFGIALDDVGNIYVTGMTNSPDFPTANAVQTAYGGGGPYTWGDAFITELNAAGSALVYSTYLGGSVDDVGNAIAVDGSGAAYVAGTTTSPNFPTAGAQFGAQGGQDAFVARVATGVGGWSGVDIGSPAIPGAQALDNYGVYSVTGAGGGIGGTSDGFHYLWQSVGGDSNLSARLTAQSGAGPAAQAGLMYRASSDPDAVDYLVTRQPDNSIVVQYRDTQGVTATIQAAATNALPIYLKVSRVGTTFTAYTSPDGVAWTAVVGSSVDLGSMPTTSMLGLAVSSATTAATSTAQFDNVRRSACPDGWSCDDIGAPALAGGQRLVAGGGTLASAVYQVESGGMGLGTVASGGASDEFRYMWQAASGDSSISARAVPGGAADPCAEAGLMYRVSTDPGAPEYSVAVTPSCTGQPLATYVQYRATQGGGTTTLAPVQPSGPAAYLRITRAGNTFTAYTSRDGSAWTAVPNSSVTVAMSSTALLGFAVTSNNASATTLAQFDTTSINGTAELAALDTATVHDTQPSGQIGAFTTEARLYNSPAGTPDDDGWHTRDTTLLASSGSGGTSGGYHTAATSYDLQTAPDTSSGIEASLTNEDAVTLGVGLASANGVAPSSSTGGQSSANSTTYSTSGTSSGSGIGANAVRPLFASNPVALSMRATASGLDVRLTLNSASAQGPFVLSLAPDPRLQIGQDATGVISMTQPVTNYGDDGTPDVITQTEYAAEAPLLTDSSGDPTAPVSTGPATATLGTASDASGAVTPTISLSVDPAWLQAAGRVFPVTLDLPLDTASALADTGTAATVSSCRPTAAAVTTALVVGAANGCAYNGQLSFDLSALPADAPILSATLRLYTPAPTTATGALVYPNAPDPGAANGDVGPPLSWATAPTVMTGSVGLAQSGSDGHWQSWDVTALAQRWAQDVGSNNGLTLAGGGAPVRLASPLGAGLDAPATAPYLDIVYGQAPGSKPRPTRCAGFTGTGSYGDCSTFIYGLAGGFAQCDGASLGDPNCPSSNNMNLQFAANGRSGSPPPNTPQGVGAQFIRFNESLASQGQTANWAQAYSNMQEAYDKGLDPIVNFGQSLSLSSAADQQGWYDQLRAFAQGLPNYRNARPTYFEIGNEPNCCRTYKFYNFTEKDGNRLHVDYPHIFGYAAVALSLYLRPSFPYRILTAGMLSPRAPLNGKDALHRNKLCSSGSRSYDGYLLTLDALHVALFEGVNFAGTGYRTFTAKRAALGLGVHPYTYQTPLLKRGGYFRNFHALAETLHTNPDSDIAAYLKDEHRPYGLCNDIELMNNTWTRRTSLFRHMPLVYTETNWQSAPLAYPHDAMVGAYLVDLMTYLYDRRCAWTNGVCRGGIAPGATPLRVMWFTGSDGGSINGGLYYNTNTRNQANSTSYEKPLTVTQLVQSSMQKRMVPVTHQSLSATPVCHNGNMRVTNDQTQPFAYFWLRNAACY